MTMRVIPPLNDQDWDVLVADLEKGPTNEQIEFVRKANEVASGFNVVSKEHAK